jgi:ribose transport system substrate-binding protein
MEDLIASKVDAIDLVTLSPTALVAEVEAATAAGIPVFACNTVPNSNKIITKVKSSDDDIGEMQANYMAQALHGKGNVVMMSAAPGVTTFADRGKAFKKRIAEVAPGIKILSEQFSQSTPQDGLRLMEDFMQTYPQIDGEYNAADTTAIGAAQVIRSAGKAGKIVITTTDFQPDTEKFIREGVINAAVVQQTVLIGRWCIRATINHMENRPVPAEIRVPVLLVTKANLDGLDLSTVRAPKGWMPPVR